MKKHLVLTTFCCLMMMSQTTFGKDGNFATPKNWLFVTCGYSYYNGNMLESPYGQTLGKGDGEPALGVHFLHALSDHFYLGGVLQNGGRDAKIAFEGDEYRLSDYNIYLAPELAYSTHINSRHNLTALCSIGLRKAERNYPYPDFAIPVDKETSIYANLSLMYSYRFNDKLGIGIQGQTFAYPKSVFSKTPNPILDIYNISLGFIRYFPYK